jgi:hypothetical protein
MSWKCSNIIIFRENLPFKKSIKLKRLVSAVACGANPIYTKKK